MSSSSSPSSSSRVVWLFLCYWCPRDSRTSDLVCVPGPCRAPGLSVFREPTVCSSRRRSPRVDLSPRDSRPCVADAARLPVALIPGPFSVAQTPLVCRWPLFRARPCVADADRLPVAFIPGPSVCRRRRSSAGGLYSGPVRVSQTPIVCRWPTFRAVQCLADAARLPVALTPGPFPVSADVSRLPAPTSTGRCLPTPLVSSFPASGLVLCQHDAVRRVFSYSLLSYALARAASLLRPCYCRDVFYCLSAHFRPRVWVTVAFVLEPRTDALAFVFPALCFPLASPTLCARIRVFCFSCTAFSEFQIFCFSSTAREPLCAPTILASTQWIAPSIHLTPAFGILLRGFHR